MTKRECDALKRRIDRISGKLAKKRDEVRCLLSEMQGLIDSFEAADEETEFVLHHLKMAGEALDRGVADKMSELV